jgi:hypothetical protein
MTTNVRVLNPVQLGPAIAPYSQAVANGFVHVAVQVA